MIGCDDAHLSDCSRELDPDAVGRKGEFRRARRVTTLGDPDGVPEWAESEIVMLELAFEHDSRFEVGEVDACSGWGRFLARSTWPLLASLPWRFDMSSFSIGTRRSRSSRV